MSQPLVSISVVSHGHRSHVVLLLADLVALGRTDIELILTLNLPEDFKDVLEHLPFPVKTIVNAIPKGFGANHNAAFEHASGEWFVVLNPDIRLPADPFDVLLDTARRQPPAIVAPLIVNDQRQEEDSARHFPTLALVFKRYLARRLGISLANDVIRVEGDVAYPDWVAGMFLVLPRTLFERMGGFDLGYHLYYEDVDLCARARLAGYEVRVARSVAVIHNAQRASHRKLRFLAWHVGSALRFFSSSTYRAICRGAKAGH
ncbi:glycosyltransferase family 2 protein [Herbaspirillum sp. DW155]|uniref:glycosyltransferase family 2 protein n=1 Tax=Herbaspirillum sp. DW155 TaxID=3095609 RepID=UPI0030920586|nr:glycosyltransferase family 2 protein [Herbaspirillum sp. DW155]